MAVHVEVRDVAMHPLAHEVGHVAERQDVGRAVKRQAVVVRQALARLHFLADWLQPAVFNVDFHITSSTSAAQNTKNSTLT